LPNGQPLIAKPSGNIETHGPYQHGSGFATVNGDGTLTPFPAQVPPTLQPSTTAYGPSQPGSFASEFGCSVFSSFESMAPTLVPADWTPHAQSMTQRNYPCDSIVQVYFGRQPDLNTTVGSQAILRKATFLCMVGQSLEMKADIENRRSQNAFGTLTWQANEIWPTGGWGSLEYGTVGFTSGQVVGGRWKPLHHLMAEHLYVDTVVLCGKDGACLLKNDNPLSSVAGTWLVEVVSYATGQSQELSRVQFALPRGAAAATWVCAGDPSANPKSGCPSYSSFLPSVGCNADGSDCAVVASLLDAQGNVMDTNVVYLATFDAIAAKGLIPDANVSAVVAQAPDSSGKVAVTVSTDDSAFFVTLTTAAQGRFSYNSFFLPAQSKVVVHFLPSAYVRVPLGEMIATLTATLHVDHVGKYLNL